MTLQTFGDRVQETFTTTGTGTISLGGPVTGYQAFSAIVANGGTCYYAATDGTNWEVGIGTYATSGDTLARTTILASSNSGSAVSWAAGTKSIWLDAPASIFGSGVNGNSDILLGTVAVSSSTAAVTFLNIPAGFDIYELNVTNAIPVTNSVALQVNMSTNNGSTYDTGNNYAYSLTYVQNGGGTGVIGTGGGASLNFFDNVANTSDLVSGFMRMYGLTTSNTQKMIAQHTMRNTSTQAETGAACYYGSSSPVNALRLQFSSGNIASGKFSLYARRNS